MRFASGRDYYDSVLAFGRDETLFFERMTLAKATYIEERAANLTAPSTRLRFKVERSWRQSSSFERDRYEYSYHVKSVWFAGEYYAGIQLTISDNGWPKRKGDSTLWFWSKEAFVQHLKTVQQDHFTDHKELDDLIEPALIDKIFDYRPTKADIDWLVENRVSIAVYSDFHYHGADYYTHTSSGWYINCDGLGDMGFAKALDPYNAFQKLSQWIGGVLSGCNKPMLKITDEKVILKKHGFDKFSFKHRRSQA